MKTDGLISDRYDALGSAVEAEKYRRSKAKLRRLSKHQSFGIVNGGADGNSILFYGDEVQASEDPAFGFDSGTSESDAISI